MFELGGRIELAITELTCFQGKKISYVAYGTVFTAHRFSLLYSADELEFTFCTFSCLPLPSHVHVEL